ncbi:MAG: hypothetical protein ABMA13_07365 [Chthoniobacteraceae bacterium]
MAREKPQKPVAEKPDRKVTIELPQGQFPAVIYANVFGLESVDGHKLIHFGLMMPPSRLVSAWACVLEGPLIENSKESWMKYLAEIEFPDHAGDTSFRCPPERLILGVPSANLAELARSGDMAEIRLAVYAMGDVLNDRREGKTGKIKGQPLAMIRLPLELQRELIAAIYSDLLS